MPEVGFERAKVRVLVFVPEVRLMVAGEKLLVIWGAMDMTSRLAMADSPEPPLEDVTLPVVLTLEPELVALTSTFTVQMLFARIKPFENVIEVAPEVGAKVGVPQAVALALGTVATSRPVGRESLNATPASRESELGLPRVIVSVLVWFVLIETGENALLMEGGLTAADEYRTVIFAAAVLPLPPLVEVTAPLVLVLIPSIVEVRFTLTVQDPPTEIVPLLKVRVDAPAVGEKVGEPQPADTTGVGVSATGSPAGRGSLKDTPVRATVFTTGLEIVKVRVVISSKDISSGEKLLLIIGEAMTVSVAEAALPVAPLDAVTGSLVFVLTPPVVGVTFTLTTQVPLAATVPPEKVNEVS
jgi:hypothetical protein